MSTILKYLTTLVVVGDQDPEPLYTRMRKELSMYKIQRPTGLLAEEICFIKGSQCGCGCQSSSPIVMNQPKDLGECSSDSKFKKQIDHNYELMFKDLEKIGCSCNEKDLTEFRKLLNEMKAKIIGVIDSYFQCDKNKDPTDAIDAAIASYDSIRKRFRSYGRNAFNKLSSNCNSVIQNVRQLPYISAENTIMSVDTCAKLKLKLKAN